MQRKFFGTDGIRGIANGDLLTPEFVLALGRAATKVMTRSSQECRVLVGRDSRVSGTMLEAALAAGILSMGGCVQTVGVVPTPALAYLTKTQDIDFGVMISASHNPVPDNGIKFFSHAGVKLEDKIELEIERELEDELNKRTQNVRKTGTEIGHLQSTPELIDYYINHLLESLDHNLSGLRIVCDMAHGSAAPYAQALFEAAGAEVIPLHQTADGTKINVKCGSTYLKPLQEQVIASGADFGLAFDGDADRVLAVDHRGQVVDGDRILYIWATHLHNKGSLPYRTLVSTVMSNMGMEIALREQGINMVRTKVGDRYVWQAMNSHQYILGGEQSGHIINSNLTTTGDGMLTGLHLAAIVKSSQKTLAELAHSFVPFPQKLVNIETSSKKKVMEDSELIAHVQQVETELADKGRVLIRPSGTQPLVRIMVEAEATELVDQILARMTEIVTKVVAKYQ